MAKTKTAKAATATESADASSATPLPAGKSARRGTAESPISLGQAPLTQSQSAQAVATEATERVKQEQAKAGKTKKVKVICIKTGYDGFQIRNPGDRFIVQLAEGEKLPPWQQTVEDYERERAEREARELEDDEE